MVEDLLGGQAVLDDGYDLAAASAFAAFEDVDVKDALEEGGPIEAVAGVLAAWALIDEAWVVAGTRDEEK